MRNMGKMGGKWGQHPWENGENGDSALFFLLKIGRCPHFPGAVPIFPRALSPFSPHFPHISHQQYNITIISKNQVKC